MGFKKAFLTGLTAAAVCLPGVANAGVEFVFNWAATGEGPDAVSSPVDELKFTAESVVVFNGEPFAAGTTFTDYVVLRIDQLFLGGNLSPTAYGPGDSMEITVLAVLQGVQDDATHYSITSGLLALIYDGPDNTYTQAIFQNLSTFTNGSIAEFSDQITGKGGNLENTPDGALDLFAILVDLLNEGDFELLRVGEENVGGQTFLAVTNSNNALCDTEVQTCASSTGAILSLFEVTLEEGQTAFHTRSDGSIEKQVLQIPEPQTVGLLGLALSLMGFAWIRRRNVV